MRLIVHEDFKPDQVEKVERDYQHPGLCAGDFAVSVEIHNKIKEILDTLKNAQQERKTA